MRRLIIGVLLFVGLCAGRVQADPMIASGRVFRTDSGTSVMRARVTGDVVAIWCVIGQQSFPLDPVAGNWSGEYWVIGEPTGSTVTFVAVDRVGLFAVMNARPY